MAKKIYFILALLMLLILPAVVKADFTIQSQLDANTVCPSNTIIINEIVSSTTDASYSVSVSGSAAQFTTAVPSGFFLNAGQQQTVFLYLTPSSKITPGSYSLTFQVTSQGTTKTVSHSVIVENCHATSIIVQPVSQQSCTCEEKTFKLTVQNNGRYLESYTINAEGPLSSYTTFSTKTFSLAPEQTIDLTAYVKAPCNVAGDYGLTFKVNAGSRYAQTEASANLNLIPCYDYSFEVEKNLYETCENQKITVPITLKNLGTQENTYSIKLDSPSWVSSDQKSLKIQAGQEKVFNLIMQPPLKTLGNFTAIVNFISEKGSISQNLNLDLHVGSCYGSSLSFDQKQDTICNGLSNSYVASIKNTGKFKNDFSMILEAPAWAKLDKTSLSLNPGEESQVLITVNPTSDVKPADYSIILKAIDPNKLETSDSLSLKTVSQEECYQPSVSSEKDQITVPLETPSTLLFTIENKGLKDSNYVIELSGTAARFSLINPSTISLASGKAQTLYLYVFPPTEIDQGDYILTLTARLKDSSISSKKEIKIKVTGESNESKPFVPENETKKEVKEKGKSFWQKIVDFFVSIFRAPEEKNVTNEAKENHPPKLLKKVPDIKLEAGNAFTVDLSNYFDDEDEDKLNFITIKPDNLDLLINGNKITIIAPKNVVGEREITFYATDGQMMISSNQVKITITPSKEPVEENETKPVVKNETKPIENKTNETKPVNKTNQTISLNKSCSNNYCSVNEPSSNETTSKPSFLVQYRSYLILAIIAAIVIILIMSGLGRKILDFFEEEEPEKKKK